MAVKARKAVRATYDRVQQFERRFAKRFAVLMYHRIATPAIDPWDIAVAPEHFSDQLSVLGELGRIVRLGDEARRARTTRLGRRDKRFAITFDDGYADNLHDAVPILERHGAPATIFIATGFLDRPHYWWDRLAALVLDSDADPEDLVVAAQRHGLFDRTYSTLATADREALHAALYESLVGRSLADIDAIIDEMLPLAPGGIDVADARPMTTDELRRLATHPLITIGVHTVDHRRLTWLDARQAMSEIVAGDRRLNDLLGPGRRSLAYPYGDAGWSTARLARRAGFDHAVTTVPAWTAMTDNPRLLPRLHVPDIDGDRFARWLAAA